MTERVICAAVWIDDGRAHDHQPTPTGFVLAGWRHHNCIALAQCLKEYGAVDEEQRAGRNQGFLTSTGRYVGREEGARIALAAGQIEAEKRLLFSEDLY